MKVAVSFIKSIHNEKDTIKLINETTADYIHVDLMDGKFTENKNYTFSEIQNILKNSTKELDVHLMVENPLKYIKDFALLNTAYITFHLEAVKDIDTVINEIHSYGIRCGISIKPETSVDKLKPYLNKIEQVLIMSVEPGKGGQEFIFDMTQKINSLSLIENRNFIISVDGGINNETINHVQNADMVVSGSYICLSNNYQNQIDMLKRISY